MAECFVGGVPNPAINPDKLISVKLVPGGGSYREFTDAELSDGNTRLVLTASDTSIKTTNYFILIKNKQIVETNMTGVSLQYLTDPYIRWRLTGIYGYQTTIVF